MAREIMIIFELEEGKAALFDGRDIMAVPLSGNERQELRQNLNGLARFLTFNAKCLSTLRQILEAQQDAAAQAEQIGKTLAQLMEPGRNAVELHDRIRELIGRAVFVAQETGQGRLN